ncbi:MAG TPA: glycosyltransferase [Candidatus Acidoferrales bacterium]|nr:glycosyltransferase [Candidatus Acidoferrales bacterium]
MPLPISVIIPAFNSAAFLPQCLESILQQTQFAHEIILVDDGSTDETSEIIRKYLPRITYLRKENGGASSARNCGIRTASQEWIAFMDADDISLPTRFDRQMKLTEQTGCELVFGDQTVFNDATGASMSWFAKNSFQQLLKGKVVLENPFEMLLRYGCFVPQSTALVRRNRLLEIGLYDESMTPIEDYDLFVRLSRRFSFAVDFAPLVLRRIHGGNISHNRLAMIEAGLRFHKKMEADPLEQETKSHREWLVADKARLYRERGSIQLSRGDFLAARRSWAQSVRLFFSWRVGVYWAVSFLPKRLLTRIQKWRHARMHPLHDVDQS